MSFLSGLCGCFARSNSPPPSTSSPEMQMPGTHNNSRHSTQTGRFTLSSDGEFIRPAVPRIARREHGPLPADADDGGYAAVVPLPQYTPRPMSIHEKTLEAHMRDSSISSESQDTYPTDEKNRNLYDEEVTSDGSSAISFPSSYGNTSTATRETPPPPYSPRHSVVLNRSRSISISSAMAVTINPPPSAHMNISRTGHARVDADDQSIRRHRRVSWESR
ncbi:hypothetical protein NUU61_005235 [Penicillium alfredii]|uniref:Uncharacterized protein n=1 Tax=Penicillium alfredii TaxID=1506179 RepID=A0A9W9K7E8_9EURO|nr:uncharacterized protein NUU61_005235 [Penicillium alfredii]KAJ5095879.1 hypothetical protein NUU61_005235 [Penicillium alfredii]